MRTTPGPIKNCHASCQASQPQIEAIGNRRQRRRRQTHTHALARAARINVVSFLFSTLKAYNVIGPDCEELVGGACIQNKKTTHNTQHTHSGYPLIISRIGEVIALCGLQNAICNYADPGPRPRAIRRMREYRMWH